MPDEQDNGKAIEALSVFCDKYEPVNESNEISDYFTSLEIQQIIYGHTNFNIELHELHDMLKSMGYHYDLQGDKFMWQVHRV